MPKMQLITGGDENVSSSTIHLLHVHFLGKAVLEPHGVQKLLLFVRESVILIGRSALVKVGMRHAKEDIHDMTIRQQKKI